MRQDGLVTAERNSSNKRLVNITLTDKGRETLNRAMPVAKEIVDQVMLSIDEGDAALNLPRTNPFLRKLFQYIAGYDLDDRIAWLVDDLAQLLAQADMEAVLRDFGKRTAKEDPVVHFYETFLKEYDPKIREMRGVYYTPEPIVSYIVRSIDHLLKTRFNKPQGLADEKTLILDPSGLHQASSDIGLSVSCLLSLPAAFITQMSGLTRKPSLPLPSLRKYIIFAPSGLQAGKSLTPG